jgi:hypothetical protein
MTAADLVPGIDLLSRARVTELWSGRRSRSGSTGEDYMVCSSLDLTYSPTLPGSVTLPSTKQPARQLSNPLEERTRTPRMASEVRW